MNKLLDYIYCGEIELQKSEVKDFKQAVRCLEVHPNLTVAGIDQMMEETNQPIKINWSKRGETFAETFKKLYQKQEDCDTILEIGNMELKAHRIVLSACSEFFKRLFNDGMFLGIHEFNLYNFYQSSIYSMYLVLSQYQ